MKWERWVFVSVAAVAAAVVFSLGEDCSPQGERRQTVPVEDVATSNVPRPDELAPSGRASPTHPAQLGAEARQMVPVFDDPAALDAFHAGMNRVTGTLRAELARERFLALGVDTEANKDRALRLAEAAYSPERGREEVRRKVLAQYFLAYSTKLRNEECMQALLMNAALARSQTEIGDLTHVYALDVLVLAKICARRNLDAVARFAREENHPRVRAQLDAALESVLEEWSGASDE